VKRTTLFVVMMLMGTVRGAHAQQPCDGLAAVKLANTTITASLVAEGPFAGAAGPGGAARPTTVPAHCEVKGVIRPTRDSEIKFALWLPAAAAWNGKVGDAWGAVTDRLWSEAKSLVRVTRIDHPEAMLVAPEQTFFVRENLKLRLLNARLALLSRQFEIAQSDLQVSQAWLDRYFDRSSRRTVLATELIRQVAVQARQGGVPRPDDSLTALTAAAAGR